MPDQFYATYPEGHELEGQEITRAAACACGAAFTQRAFSERMLAIAERAGAITAMSTQLPGLWVPAHCPTCERAEIRQLERISIYGRAR